MRHNDEGFDNIGRDPNQSMILLVTYTFTFSMNMVYAIHPFFSYFAPYEVHCAIYNCIFRLRISPNLVDSIILRFVVLPSLVYHLSTSSLLVKFEASVTALPFDLEILKSPLELCPSRYVYLKHQFYDTYNRSIN